MWLSLKKQGVPINPHEFIEVPHFPIEKIRPGFRPLVLPSARWRRRRGRHVGCLQEGYPDRPGVRLQVTYPQLRAMYVFFLHFVRGIIFIV